MTQTANSSGAGNAQPQTTALAVFNLEDYVEQFTSRYKEEEGFRKKVHGYLELTFARRAALSVAQWRGIRSIGFVNRWYENASDTVIQQYAEAIQPDLEKAEKLQEKLAELEAQKKILDAQAAEVAEVRQESESAQSELTATIQEEEQKVASVEVNYQASVRSEKERLEAEKQSLLARTDVEAVVKATIERELLSTELMKRDENGAIVYDDTRLMQALEDKILDEVLSDLKGPAAKAGFIKKLKKRYETIYVGDDQIEDLSELENVNWPETIVRMLQEGRRHPMLHHFIADKYDIIKLDDDGKLTLDSALAIDSSGSMRDYAMSLRDRTGELVDHSRWDIGKRATLAGRALMRKMNPDNEQHLCHWNYQLHEMDARKLYKFNDPDGGTSMHLALDWLLRTLGNEKIGVGYLVTDGFPSDMDMALRSARRFQEYPLLRLRIILVDGDAEAVSYIEQIAQASGKDTKYMNIRSDQLAGAYIDDIARCFTEMKSVVEDNLYH